MCSGVIQVRIKKATGLPPSLSHFVFCQYNFWSQMEPVVVPPMFDPNEAESNTVHKPESLVFQFGHERVGGTNFMTWK